MTKTVERAVPKKVKKTTTSPVQKEGETAVASPAGSGEDGNSLSVENTSGTKKRKREKYALKACEPCKRRKIKCGGGYPCETCVIRRRPCDNGDGTGEAMLLEHSGLAHDSQQRSELNESSREPESTRALHERLAALESNLSLLTQILLPKASIAAATHASDNSEDHSPSSQLQEQHVDQDTDTEATICMPSSHSAESPGQECSPASSKDYSARLAFESGKTPAARKSIGETSISHLLQRVEDQLSAFGLPVVERSSAPATPPLTPLPSGPQEEQHELSRTKLVRAFKTHGIEPDKALWDQYLNSYLNKVHPLYPFMHESSVREMYNQLWVMISLEEGQSEEEVERHDQVVLILLIMAIGRCSLSCRADDGGGLHSAGWSLYCTATQLQGNLLDAISDDSRPLESLQTLALMVVYLFRLEANERAQNILALAITHAHHLGVHMDKVHDQMSLFEGEMFRRVWWCMYVLDRRLALMLGRPFLIHDINISVGLPRDLPEPYTLSAQENGYSLDDATTQASSPSPIQYLGVMIGYSRLVGKVWETLYGAKVADTAANDHVHEYLEALVNEWHSSVPKSYLCDPENLHRSSPDDTSSSQFSQSFLIQVRYFYILILIQQPMLRYPTSSLSHDNIKSQTICMQYARRVVEMFAQCTHADGVYAFPFFSYLMNSTIGILASLTKVPYLKDRYLGTIDIAVKMLNQFCQKTWISGKMARVVWKLNDIVPRLMTGGNNEGLQTQIPERDMNKWVGNQLPQYHIRSIGNSNKRDPTHQQHPFPSPSADEHNVTYQTHPHTTTSHSLIETSLNMDWDLPSTEFNTEFEFSMIADFPFELQLGTGTSKPLGLSNIMAGDGRDENLDSNSWFSSVDIDWLEGLVATDPINTAFAC